MEGGVKHTKLHNDENLVKLPSIENDMEIISLDDGDQTNHSNHFDVTMADEQKRIRENKSLIGCPFIIQNAFVEKIPTGNESIVSPDDKDIEVKGMENKADLNDEKRGRTVKGSATPICFVKFVTLWSSTVSEAVGVPGLKYVVSNQDGILRRLIWLVAIVGGMVAAGYQIWERATVLFGNPKTVDLRVVHVDKITFPAVTICNYNTFRNFNLENECFGQMLIDINTLGPHGAGVNFTKYQLQCGDLNTTALYLDLAHQMKVNEMFIRGSWNGAELTPLNFTTIITDFGVCHTFNGGHVDEEVRQVKVGGKSYGFSLLFNIQQEYYFFSKKNRGAAGAMVAIHDQDEIPLVESLGIAVSAGTEARIALQRKETRNLEPPHHLSVCGSIELKYFDSYTKNKCQLECLIDHILEVCGCVEPFMAAFATDKRVCGVVEVFECSEPKTRDFNGGGECICPIPCKVTQFVPYVSTARFPSDFYASSLADSYFGNNEMINYFGTNLVLLEVYYEDTTIERSTQYQTYDFFGFLCDFGGAIGLWLGGSILTLLEIVEHVYYTMFVNNDASTFKRN